MTAKPPPGGRPLIYRRQNQLSYNTNTREMITGKGVARRALSSDKNQRRARRFCRFLPGSDRGPVTAPSPEVNTNDSQLSSQLTAPADGDLRHV